MEKRYQPANIETRLYEAWEASGVFAPTPGKSAKDAFCIMLPPPNVTGTLHMGHAFQVALMDCLIRHQRMCGNAVLWQAGTDHAGIATQMLVERQLLQEGVARADIGRDAFIAKVWEWKQQSGNTITQQLRRLGASLDWSTERFTMDDGLSQAVRHAFVSLYNEGLIFKGKRLVNWDPVLKTAVSDLEVVSQEEEGKLWHIRYPLADGSGMVTVATTRPETMFGDSAIAVHPEDSRYQKLIGTEVILPVAERRIKIIADEHVDPEFGTGCVKVTPAHDFNDYQIGLRHQLELINILNPDASLNDAVPADYRGLDRYEARRKLVAALTDLGLLAKEEKHLHTVPYGDRSQSVIEPLLTDQWFVKTKPLAEAAINAVDNGDVRFYPEHWTKVYLDWMHNIEDWCISRQIWWGHRIPAWYDEAGQVYVGESEEQIRKEHNIPEGQSLSQDEDVLDTWFSSALWPFSTLGWPQKTEALKTFYPTSVLVTGFDIIFFWAARMIMMGLKFTGEVPFRKVYIHGLVRDSDGQKMSKSKGNVLDPIDLIDGIGGQELLEKQTRSLMQPEMKARIAKSTKKHYPNGIQDYGTDALRFTFIAMASTGRDIEFDVNRIEGYRNFCNKLWNAARFTSMLCKEAPPADATSTLLCDRWIQSKLNTLIEECDQHLAVYRFDLLADAIYKFVWCDFSDWYLELVKLVQNDGLWECDAEQKSANLNVLVQALETVLRLLHPVTPYISEEIWQELKPLSLQQDEWLQQRPWPSADGQQDAQDAEVIATMEHIQSFVNTIRRIRSVNGIAPGEKIPLRLEPLKERNTDGQKLFAEHGAVITSLSKTFNAQWFAKGTEEEKATDIEGDEEEKATDIVGNTKVTILIPIDIEAEIARVFKIFTRIKNGLEKKKTRLENEDFTNKAPPALIEKDRVQVKDFEEQLPQHKAQLINLLITCQVEDFGLIQVNGSEAEEFLQKMSTNNFNDKGEEEPHGAFCNSKGQVIANFIVNYEYRFSKIPTYYLALPKDLIEDVIQYLQKFKLTADVHITDVSEEYRVIGLTLPGVFDVTLDSQAMHFTILDPLNIKEVVTLKELIYIHKDLHDEYWASLFVGRDGTKIKDPNVWRLKDVLQRFVWVRKATSRKMIPQSLNLDLAKTVSFDKGYLGGGIIAQHLIGKLKKRTYQFCADGEHNFEVGADVYIEGQDAPCGIIVDSVCSDGKVYTLAMINIKDCGLKLCSPQSGPSLGLCNKDDTENYEYTFDPKELYLRSNANSIVRDLPKGKS